MQKTMITAVAVSMALSGISFAAAKAPAGEELLEKRCSVCHPSARSKGVKKTAEEWESTVTRMIRKGAKLSGDEKKALVDYLSKTYKP